MTQKKVLLVDGYAMMFRAFYAVKFAPMHEGKPVGAVFGCATTLLQALGFFKPDYVVMAFDAPEKTFRHEIDPSYKAQREKAPDEFIDQIALTHELIECFGIPLLIKPGFEADDIIGTLAKKGETLDYKSFILSGDLDFLQLINPQTTLAKFNGAEPLVFDRQKAFDRIGVYPEQIIDYKAIAGDSSDNYKGIPGVGSKGAAELLGKYHTLEGIYEHLEELRPKVREKFETFKSQAFHCQNLATIHTHVTLDFDLKTCPEFELNNEALGDFFDKMGFRQLHGRLAKLNTNKDQEFNKEQNNSSKKTDSEDQMSLF